MGKLDSKILNMDTWKKEHKDYIVRAVACDGMVRAFAATTKNLVQEAHDRHHTTPVCTAALGRLLTAASMMGVMLKGDDDLITLTIRGDGPMQGLMVTGDSHGDVKGFVYNPNVKVPDKRDGKLNVGAAVGKGTLMVVRDQEFGEPYTSQVALVSGEIAEDLTYYFAASEQIPSSVGLGVLLRREDKEKGDHLLITNAGGFIVQLMPGCTDEVVDQLEKRLKEVRSMDDFLKEGMGPEDILNEIFEGMDLEITDTMPTQFYCNCNRDHVEKVLLSVGKEELQNMINDGKPVELVCHFCGKKYSFSVEDLKRLQQSAKSGTQH